MSLRERLARYRERETWAEGRRVFRKLTGGYRDFGGKFDDLWREKRRISLSFERMERCEIPWNVIDAQRRRQREKDLHERARFWRGVRAIIGMKP